MKRIQIIIGLIVILAVLGSIAIPLFLNSNFNEITYVEPIDKENSQEKIPAPVDKEDTIFPAEKEDTAIPAPKQDGAKQDESKKDSLKDVPQNNSLPERQNPINSPSQQPASEPQVKDTWVQEKINENRDNIDDADLEAGAAIYNQLDTDYIFGLLKDGLTDEERTEFINYLENTLSGEDLDRAMSLYSEYIGLVE